MEKEVIFTSAVQWGISVNFYNPSPFIFNSTSINSGQSWVQSATHKLSIHLVLYTALCKFHSVCDTYLNFVTEQLQREGGGDLLVQISKKCSNRLPFVLVCNTTNWSNTNCRPRAKNFISIHQIVHWNWSLLNLHPLKINVGTNSSGWQ